MFHILYVFFIVLHKKKYILLTVLNKVQKTVYFCLLKKKVLFLNFVPTYISNIARHVS